MESLTLTSCRVCLQCCSDANSLFDEVEYDEYIKLTSVFKKVTTIEILENETARPTNLCQECTERLLSAYEFICAVEKAEQEIENYVSQDVVAEADEQQEEEEHPHCDDAEIHEIEVLDEEFLTDQEFVDNGTVDETILEDDIIAESTPAVYFGLKKSESTDSEKKTCTLDLVGSRLSKRQSSNYVKCGSCQRSFAKMETLERHIKMAHTVVPSISAQTAQKISSDDTRITCPHCPQFFKRRNNYIRHLMTCHSKEAVYLTPEDKELVKSKQNYKRGICPHCGESFTQASLIIHIRRHTGENPYQCDQCEKAYPRRQDLNIHQRKHTGEKPHTCTVCGKSFSRANKLARHMRIHTGERPYKCTKCERSFAQSNDLKIHTRRHTGEKPYKCSVCSEAFICGSALKTHRRQKNHHSPSDVYDDPFENWRVSKRKVKMEVNQEISSDKEYYSEAIDEQMQNDLEENYKSTEDMNESGVKLEIVEITPD